MVPVRSDVPWCVRPVLRFTSSSCVGRSCSSRPCPLVQRSTTTTCPSSAPTELPTLHRLSWRIWTSEVGSCSCFADPELRSLQPCSARSCAHADGVEHRPPQAERAHVPVPQPALNVQTAPRYAVACVGRRASRVLRRGSRGSYSRLAQVSASRSSSRSTMRPLHGAARGVVPRPLRHGTHSCARAPRSRRALLDALVLEQPRIYRPPVAALATASPWHRRSPCACGSRREQRAEYSCLSRASS